MTKQDQSLTKNQSLVFKALAGSEVPLTAYGLLDRLRTEGFKAPPQVYRALEALVDRGMVHRLESLNAFVACAHESCHPSGLVAFAICDDCGQATEFNDEFVAQRLQSWSAERSFKPHRTTIEIRGECGECHGLTC
ncbi:MAG: Fur family transcriptional regulator [Pseudomonadota bacterium]